MTHPSLKIKRGGPKKNKTFLSLTQEKKDKILKSFSVANNVTEVERFFNVSKETIDKIFKEKFKKLN
jgi:hypothetical protein